MVYFFFRLRPFSTVRSGLGLHVLEAVPCEVDQVGDNVVLPWACEHRATTVR